VALRIRPARPAAAAPPAQLRILLGEPGLELRILLGEPGLELRILLGEAQRYLFNDPLLELSAVLSQARIKDLTEVVPGHQLVGKGAECIRHEFRLPIGLLFRHPDLAQAAREAQGVKAC
jgi:hypothetical protein